MRRIFRMLLIWVTAALLTACSSEVTASDLMVEYAPPARFTAWMYVDAKSSQSVQQRLKRIFAEYDSKTADGKKIVVEEFRSEDYSPEQFAQKLSAAIMGGRGPDLILSDTSGSYYSSGVPYFEDPQKLVAGGCFSAWDEMRESEYWMENQYFSSVWDASQYTDGKVYLLPIGINYGIIRTTKQAMEAFGATDGDFSDSLKLLNLLENAKETAEQPVCYGDMSCDVAFSGIFDYTARSTNLLSEPQYTWVGQWKKLFADQPFWFELGEDTSEYHYNATLHMLEGSSLLQFFGTDELDYVFGFVDEEKSPDWNANQHLYYPVCDDNGDWVGEVLAYAAIAQGSACKNEVYGFMRYYLFEFYDNAFIYGKASPCTMNHYTNIETNRLSGMSDGHRIQYLQWLQNHPKRLIFPNDVISDFRTQIKAYSSDADRLKSVADQLNIYLSE